MLSVALGMFGCPGSDSPTCSNEMKALLAYFGLIVSLHPSVTSTVNWGKQTPISWFLLLPSGLLRPVSTNSALTANHKGLCKSLRRSSPAARMEVITVHPSSSTMMTWLQLVPQDIQHHIAVSSTVLAYVADTIALWQSRELAPVFLRLPAELASVGVALANGYYVLSFSSFSIVMVASSRDKVLLG